MGKLGIDSHYLNPIPIFEDSFPIPSGQIPATEIPFSHSKNRSIPVPILPLQDPLKSEYHASDPLHACVYILCLHSAVSHEYTFITNILHKTTQHFTRYNDFLINMGQYKLNLGDHFKYLKSQPFSGTPSVQRITGIILTL